MAKLYLLIGGNIENRVDYLQNATEKISEEIGCISDKSSIFETEPWGFEHDTYFLNQILVVEASIYPQEVLKKIHKIEAELGRKRISEQYSARTIDIDILFYDDLIFYTEPLIIPHLHIHERKFVLAPLLELCPEMIHPVLGKSVRQLYAECADTTKVQRFN